MKISLKSKIRGSILYSDTVGRGFLNSCHFIFIKINEFLLQSLKIFTFRVKSSESIFLLLGLSPIFKFLVENIV